MNRLSDKGSSGAIGLEKIIESRTAFSELSTGSSGVPSQISNSLTRRRKAPRRAPLRGRMRASKLDPYKDYIRKRFQEDCMNATKILDEIQKLGYCGCRTIMMD